MQANVTGLKLVLMGAAMIGGTVAWANDGLAKPQKSSAHVTVTHASASMGSASRGFVSHALASSGTKRVRIGGHGRKDAGSGVRSFASYGNYGGGYLQCVPFARENSGIELSGNASAWWSAAQGIYERGSRPEIGSVLNFRSNGRMHSGHVAVVTNVDNGRTVEIDHANWGGPGGNRGGVSRNVTVVDVSPANDWSAVRVALGRSGDFGSVYPTFGFIYDRPDNGTMVANTSTAPMPLIANAPPRDLRPAYEQIEAAAGDEPVEVAEATVRGGYRHAGARHGIVHRVRAIATTPATAHHGRKHTRG